MQTALVVYIDALGNEQSLKVNYSGRITHVNNVNGCETGYSYDEAGNCIKETYPDGTYIEYEYNMLYVAKWTS
ncbi:MAG: RHS repeat protein [Lachnospiraceae bacterium]|nr:RHS repeat protein [Lachnospiraceae bacterium]